MNVWNGLLPGANHEFPLVMRPYAELAQHCALLRAEFDGLGFGAFAQRLAGAYVSAHLPTTPVAYPSFANRPRSARYRLRQPTPGVVPGNQPHDQWAMHPWHLDVQIP